mmetsp:Transcript_26897/g.56468  ORF Transcript_26897/g.56468 Transcript_26897/m.56468 type:complete len:328 (-) Transcript_26897:1109-2092(-)
MRLSPRQGKESCDDENDRDHNDARRQTPGQGQSRMLHQRRNRRNGTSGLGGTRVASVRRRHRLRGGLSHHRPLEEGVVAPSSLWRRATTSAPPSRRHGRRRRKNPHPRRLHPPPNRTLHGRILHLGPSLSFLRGHCGRFEFHGFVGIRRLFPQRRHHGLSKTLERNDRRESAECTGGGGGEEGIDRGLRSKDHREGPRRGRDRGGPSPPMGQESGHRCCGPRHRCDDVDDETDEDPSPVEIEIKRRPHRGGTKFLELRHGGNVSFPFELLVPVVVAYQDRNATKKENEKELPSLGPVADVRRWIRRRRRRYAEDDVSGRCWKVLRVH